MLSIETDKKSELSNNSNRFYLMVSSFFRVKVIFIKMKPFHSLTFTTIVLFLVLVNMQNTPKFTEAGPATTATCILACCGTACASASAVCKQKNLIMYLL